MAINLPYCEINFVDEQGNRTDYCKWTLPCTFRCESWRQQFYRDLEEKLYIMQELTPCEFAIRSEVLTYGVRTTYHGISYQWVRVIEQDNDHITVLVRDI